MKKSHTLPVRADCTMSCGVYGAGLESRVGAVFNVPIGTDFAGGGGLHICAMPLYTFPWRNTVF